MSRRPVLVVLLSLSLVATACTAEGTGTTSSSTSTSTTTTTAPATTIPPTTTLPPTTSTSTTTTLPEETRVVVTSTGVPVAVIDEIPGGFLVMTPCGFETEVFAGEELGPVSVVLDPGHGGPTDTGAVGANGLPEKEVNLAVALQAQAILAERGIEAILTRTADYTSPLFVRANLADTVEADLMVSIHHNAPTPGPSDKPGIEIFIQNESPDSARLGGLLWEHTRAGLDVFDIPWSAAADAGVMTVLNSRGTDAYGIIRHPETTTSLVELGYLSNPPEAELFARPEYPPIAGAAIADAIEEFLFTDGQGSGFVDGRIFDPRPGVSQDACTDPDLG